MTAADLVRRHALGSSARLGTARLVCVDGPSGSGKSTLAQQLVAGTSGPVALVAVDEMLPGGWDGLPGLAARVELLLRSVAGTGEGWWQRWDWESDRWAEWHLMRCGGPGGLVVLEGVGSWHPSYADLVTTLVWVEAGRDARRARGIARDDGMAEHWRRWSVAEDALHRTSRTRGRADVRVWT